MKFKRLIPALCMLLVSALLMGTATFAWFSMNEEVTATNVEIVAKSDSTYLLISKTNNTATAIQTENLTTVDLDAADTKLYPASPAMDSTEAGYLTTSGKDVDGAAITTAGVQVTNATTAAAVTNWFTAAAAAPSAAAIKADTARQLKSFTDYVLVKTVYLTVAQGSNDANNLQISGVFTQNSGGTDISAVKALVVTDDGGFATLTSAAPTADIKGSNTAITDTTVRRVDIYVYYDGDETPVYTNNAANLKGATIDFTFSVDPVTA